jgi:hypothetical protein
MMLSKASEVKATLNFSDTFLANQQKTFAGTEHTRMGTLMEDLA